MPKGIPSRGVCSIEGCSKVALARGWCPAHYNRWRIHGSPIGGAPDRPRGPLAERFWARVDKRGPDECWHWTAGSNKNGYGAIKVDGRDRRATHIAYEMAQGPIPAGLFVCHSCDNPPCVNPAHLFLGTHAENMADAVRKGRLYRFARGEAHNHAKLTENDVREIRRLQASERLNDCELARRYGVTSTSIRLIRLRRTWKDTT